VPSLAQPFNFLSLALRTRATAYLYVPLPSEVGAPMNHRQASRATNAAAIIRAHTDIKLYSSDHSPLSLTIFLNTIFGARRHQVRFLVKSATCALT
jgi:hypothetical protein